MSKRVAASVVVILIVNLALNSVIPLAARADEDGNALGHLYAGTSDPAIVYEYVGGRHWKPISPTPQAALAVQTLPNLSHRQTIGWHGHRTLGRAVLDLIYYEGHLYAGTESLTGIGQVWRYDGGTAWTLVGDDLDDRVSSLRASEGSLYAATGSCSTRIYEYKPEVAPGSARDWVVHADLTGRLDRMNEGSRPGSGTVSCVHDVVEHRGDAYLAANHAVFHRSPDESGWHPFIGSESARPTELEILGGLLFTGYGSGISHGGELRVTDGTDWPGQLVFTARGGIQAMTTDQQYLYFGTGSDPDRETSGGQVYRIDEQRSQPEPISEGLRGSIQALYAVAPSGLDLSQLERGDILLVRGPGVVNGVIGFVATYLGGSYWIHGGMYAGEGNVVESSSAVAEDFGMVRTVPISETLFWEEDNYWAAMRVTQQDARDMATSYAEDQEGDLYNVDYPFWGLPIRQICQLLQPIIGIDPAVCCGHRVANRDTEDDCFYCTHLPWRAYHTQGIDLDSDAAWPARIFAPLAIPGDDLYYDDDVTLIDQRKGLRAVVVSAVGSPAEMLVLDPQGRRTGVHPDTGEILDEIPEVTYGRVELPPILDFFLPGEWASDFIAIPDLEKTWEIRIKGAQRGEYTLGAQMVDWQHHYVQTITRTTVAGQVDVFRMAYPRAPGGLIIRSSEVYLPVIMRIG